MERDAIGAALRHCADASSGRAIHHRVVEAGIAGDTFVSNLLIQMYSRCGSVADARAVFDGLYRKNLFSWTLMIAAYHGDGSSLESLRLFRYLMLDGSPSPDAVLIVTVLGAVACAGKVELGDTIIASIHGELDAFIGSAAVTMYGRCGGVDRAVAAFERISRRNVVVWNAMLTVYTQSGHPALALHLAAVMDLEGVGYTDVTFIAVFEASAMLGLLLVARRAFLRALESGIVAAFPAVGNAAVDALARCGSLEQSRSAFESIPEKTVVSWTAMVAVYAQRGHTAEAMTIFRRMDLEGSKPNEVTMINVVTACMDLSQGRVLHERIHHSGLAGRLIVANCLVAMYARCGRSVEAMDVFAAMPERSTSSWNAAIAAVARDGEWWSCFALHGEMVSEGLVPDAITAMLLLYACSHAGMVEEGCSYLSRLRQDFGIDLEETHFSCLIDLLGRAGRVGEAQRVVEEMPCSASFVAWKALLAACKTQGDTKVAENAFQLQPESAGYVMLSDVIRQHLRRISFAHPSLTSCINQLEMHTLFTLVHPVFK